jgi:hypothetical protein
VIGALEDADDYKGFEAAIIADYDAQSAVERELVLRLASLLWRLRRATTMETGLFDIQADYLREFRQARHVQPDSRSVVHAKFGGPDPLEPNPDGRSPDKSILAPRTPHAEANCLHLAATRPPSSSNVFRFSTKGLPSRRRAATSCMGCIILHGGD